MGRYGTKEEIEEFINQRMGVRTGKEFYTLMSTLDLMKYIWIQEILKYYMLQVTKEEGMSIPMLEVAPDQVYINQRMEEIHGLK